MNKKILFLTLLGVLVLPTVILAAEEAPPLLEDIIDATVNTALYIASGVIVILWVVTGLLFLSAQGAPEKLTTARKALIAAVAGTVLVIVATSAINIIGPAFGL